MISLTSPLFEFSTNAAAGLPACEVRGSPVSLASLTTGRLVQYVQILVAEEIYLQL